MTGGGLSNSGGAVGSTEGASVPVVGRPAPRSGSRESSPQAASNSAAARAAEAHLVRAIPQPTITLTPCLARLFPAIARGWWASFGATACRSQLLRTGRHLAGTSGQRRHVKSSIATGRKACKRESRRPDSNRGPLHCEGKTSEGPASTRGHPRARCSWSSAI
jgi:hypothetical protein